MQVENHVNYLLAFLSRVQNCNIPLQSHAIAIIVFLVCSQVGRKYYHFLLACLFTSKYHLSVTLPRLDLNLDRHETISAYSRQLCLYGACGSSLSAYERNECRFISETCGSYLSASWRRYMNKKGFKPRTSGSTDVQPSKIPHLI